MTIKLFMKLFRGLTRGYGEKLANGTNVCRKEPLTQEIYQAHLDGTRHIGVYHVKDNNQIHWACLDVDDVGAKGKAKKLYKRARDLGLTPIIECSSSGVGYHLWFCFDKPIPTWQGHLLLEDIKIITGFQNDNKVEIFPPQPKGKGKGSWGNFVYLPLQGKLKKEGKTQIYRWRYKTPKKNYGLGPHAKDAIIPKILVNELVPLQRNPKKKSDIEDKTAEQIFKDYGVVLEQAQMKKGELWAICPNPNYPRETEPSWSIHNEKKIWHCFGCGQSGYIDQIVEWVIGADIWEDFEKPGKIPEYNENKTSIIKTQNGNDMEIADFGFEITEILTYPDANDKGESREIVFNKKGTPPKTLTVPWEDLVDKRAFSRLITKHNIGTFKGVANDFLHLKGEKENKLVGKPKSQIRGIFGFPPKKKSSDLNQDFYTVNFSLINGKRCKHKTKFDMEEGILESNFPPFSVVASPGNNTLQSLLTLFKKAYPNIPIEIALGWIFAGIYTPEIRRDRIEKAFPLLYLAGVPGTGKTGLARNLMGLWGTQQILNLTGATIEGVRATLERASNTVVCVDDIRQAQLRNPEGKAMKSLLKATYDGIGGAKGTIHKGIIRHTTLNCCTLLTGEDIPEDDAFQTRSVILPCNKTQFGKETTQAFDEIRDNLPELAGLLLQKLRRKSQKEWAIIADYIQACKDHYKTHFDQERQAFVWAVPTATFCYFFDQKPHDGLLDRFIAQGKEAEEIRKEEDPGLDFIETLNEFIGGRLPYHADFRQNTEFRFQGEKILLIKFRPSFRLWMEVRNRKGEPRIKERILKTYLVEKEIIEKQSDGVENRYSIAIRHDGRREYWTPIQISKIDREIIPNIIRLREIGE